MTVPVARAAVDERGYFVTCPHCGDQFVGVEQNFDVDAPKDANQQYAQHFYDKHMDTVACDDEQP